VIPEPVVPERSAGCDTGPLPRVTGRGVQHPGARPPGIYRTRRTGLALALMIATAFLEIPMLRAFVDAAFSAEVPLDRTIASLLMVVGLPFFAFGCFAAIGGAAAVPGQDARVWFRTPLAYLPVALLIFLAAALAAR
ncbi:MAG: hypothetical protein JXA67_15375, partial [Micromonosporaceae bacterium]|nr:hypothetical protein [Micromonosporaceae bacterium]